MSAPTISIDAHPNSVSRDPNGVGGLYPTSTHLTCDDQILAGAGGLTPAGPPIDPAPAIEGSAAQSVPTPSAAPKGRLGATAVTVSLADPFLALAADVVDDLERVRIANENRLRQLTRTETDADGLDRGFGLDESNRDVARLAALIETLGKSEHEAVLNLGRHMRKHPLGPWVKAAKGVGEKQAARLLAAIGDPAWNTLTGEWRTLRQLYSYCGYGDAERQVRRRGERANWDANAKMRVYLVAASCIQVGHGDRFRAVYDEGRARYADAVHEQECKRCGPAGAPAQPCSPLSLGHQDGRARRLVCKAILRDLWLESRRLHGFNDEEVAA